MNFALLVTDITYAFSFVLTVVFGLWIYLKGSRKTSHIMFLLMTLALGVFELSHIFGISTPDPLASRDIFTMSVCILFFIAFAVHWIAATVEREKENEAAIALTYVISIILSAFFLLSPDSFLQTSSSVLYFPNYYVAGPYYWLLIVFSVYGYILMLSMLYKSYRMSDSTHRNRLMYYILAIALGFPFGAAGFLLMYGINVDPIYAVGFNLFLAPLAYGTLRYDVLEIKRAARKTIAYTAFVIATVLFILLGNVGDAFLHSLYPGFPSWSVPLASALVIVFFAGFIWERMRDIETLKYEFITVVTHKFRTPLTRIKWAAEMLKHHAHKDEDEELALSEIENANEHLVELTDILISLRATNDVGYLYELAPFDICVAVEKAAKNMRRHIEDKGIRFSLICPSQRVFVNIDARRIFFAFQIVIENALMYTPKGGRVGDKISSDGRYGVIEVRDTGIGIASEDMSRLFYKFWRSKEAKVADTEGMGIGLFMAREIIDRHGGDITATSAGIGKGATFTIRLPLASKE